MRPLTALPRCLRAGRRAGALLGALVAAVAGVAVTPIPGSRAVAAATGDRWVWPLSPTPEVAARFAAPPGPYAPGHRGVDLVGHPGQPVRSAGPGTVAFAGRVAGLGVVAVVHPGGLRTTYQPVLAGVRAGDPVRSGDPLGWLASLGSHCLPRTCLHWGLVDAAGYRDPRALLGAHRVRLLPVWAATSGSAPVRAPPPGPTGPERPGDRPPGPVPPAAGLVAGAAVGLTAATAWLLRHR